MPALDALREANSSQDFAALLGVKAAHLTHVLYIKPMASQYKTFEIPKRSGGMRTIAAPLADLAMMQSHLKHLLQQCVTEIEANEVAINKMDSISHGFRKGKSILTNANPHRKRRFVFNVDLRDFFPSINFGRVRGYFLADNRFKLDAKIATLIGQLACFENKLPQGSPASPIISNLIARSLDSRLVALARDCKCTYTRYADDLTFSTNAPTFPEKIGLKHDGHSWVAGYSLVRLVENSGFGINNSKTRMQYRSSRQTVTGLSVNERVNVQRDYRRRVRAMTHRLLTTGAFHFNGASEGIEDGATASNDPKHLQGMLSFITSVDSFHQNKTGIGGGGVTSQHRLHARFCMYHMLYRAKLPVIICEGATDNIYLVHAIRSLATSPRFE